MPRRGAHDLRKRKQRAGGYGG